MSNIAKLMQQAAAGAAGGAEPLAIEDVFSTYLYTGNSSTQTITNGIDLAGEGGMVWLKGRTTVSGHGVYDTERGVQHIIQANSTAADYSPFSGVTAFNSNGFTIGSQDNNNSGVPNVSWTFRKAPRFFDVVTYTGTGSARTVSHNLGLAPGCIMVKKTSSVSDWRVYHRSNTANPETDYLQLNGTAGTVDDNSLWNDTAPTATEFTVGTDANVNGNGATYVAYLFAHDPLGPSGDGSDGLIACGSWSGTGANQTINIGFEPQWMLVKDVNSVSNWFVIDNMRGFTVTTNYPTLYPNSSSAEATFTSGYTFRPTATGIELLSTDTNFNAVGDSIVYIAIRRGPMREPTSGTEVFSPQTAAGVQTTNFVVDAFIGVNNRTSLASYDPFTRARLLGGAPYLTTSSTAAEATGSDVGFDSNTGLKFSWGSAGINWYFRRAPGFFDVVAYTGNGVAGRTVSHNLGVAPELMIVKRRNAIDSWQIYSKDIGIGWFLQFDADAKSNYDNAVLLWGGVQPTNTVFTLGYDSSVNGLSSNYITYLFATLPGVSKVGSYTGNGSSQTIDCGFTSGARFVLIKATNVTGDWNVYDTARGIVSGNDPYLALNTTSAENTSWDLVDPASSGFIVNNNNSAPAAGEVNALNVSYIFLAIA